MDKREAISILDGLYAYDSGSTAGIYDVTLKEQLRQFIALEHQKEENKHRLYPLFIEEYLRAGFYREPYGLEDVVAFAEWFDREMT